MKAQSIEKQVIGSMGGTSSAPEIILTSTLGEMAVETKTGSFTLTEGFNQANETSSVAIKDISILADYTLYPNPSSDRVNLNLTLSENLTGLLQIRNSIGEKVLESQSFFGTVSNSHFDISSLANGIYYVNIYLENNKAYSISFLKK